MRLGLKLKHRFFNAFRELFVHHHGSLDFRAKVFALIIASNEIDSPQHYELVKDIGMKIYNEDEDRADLLMLSTQELVQKVKERNGLDIDTLALHIQQELKIVPRYAKKIDIDSLKELLNLTKDIDTLSYQENILEFLEGLKNETLKYKEHQIALDEERLGKEVR